MISDSLTPVEMFRYAERVRQSPTSAAAIFCRECWRAATMCNSCNDVMPGWLRRNGMRSVGPCPKEELAQYS